MKRDILGLAMCGGTSSRMGTDKAEIVVRTGKSQLEYTLDLLGLVCLRVGVSVGEKERILAPGIETVFDESNVSGPVAGVVAGLRVANGWPILAIACDMPYLEMSHIVQIVNRRNSEKLATTFLAEDGKPEPMCSIYEPACLALLEARIAKGRFGLRGFLSNIETETISLDRPQCLVSVNDPEQLRLAQERFSGNV